MCLKSEMERSENVKVNKKVSGACRGIILGVNVLGVFGVMRFL